MRLRADVALGMVAAVAMLSLTFLTPASMPASGLAQSLTDCTGGSDVPNDRQILGCSTAIESGNLAGKELAAAFSNRGRAYDGKGDAGRAMADYSEAVRLDPGSAEALFRRGIVRRRAGDKAGGDADGAAAGKLDPGLVE
jgi:tetratricopeptide (TPR) repeat protein